MALLQQLTDGIPNGDTITAGNSGSTSGDAWTLVTDTASGTCTAATTGAIHGARCMSFSLGATSGPERRGWSVNAANSAAVQWIRFYVDPSTITGTVGLARAMNLTSSAQRYRVQIAAGIVTLRDKNNTAVWTSTAITVTTRVECSAVGADASAGRILLYDGESTTASQDSGTITGDWGGPIREMHFGQTAAATNVSGRLDTIAWSDQGQIGPYVRSGSATLGVSIAPSSTGTPVRSGAATLSVTLTPSAAGTPVRVGAATLGLGITPVSTGVPVRSGAATLALGVTPTAVGTPVRSGAATLIATITPASSGVPVRSGSSTLAVSLALLSAGTPVRLGAATLQLAITPSSTGAVVDLEPGVLTPGGSAPPTLTPSGSSTSTLTPSGRP